MLTFYYMPSALRPKVHFHEAVHVCAERLLVVCVRVAGKPLRNVVDKKADQFEKPKL